MDNIKIHYNGEKLNVDLDEFDLIALLNGTKPTWGEKDVSPFEEYGHWEGDELCFTFWWNFKKLTRPLAIEIYKRAKKVKYDNGSILS